MALNTLKVESAAKKFAMTGQFFKVVSASGALKVRFEFADGSEVTTDLYQGLGIDFSQNFKAFWLESPESQSIVVWAGLGRMTDDRSEMALSGSATLITSAVTVAAGAPVKICDARLGRAVVTVFTDSPLFMGGESVTVETGFPIEESIEINTQAAIYVIGEAAANVRVLEEVN